MDPNSSDIKRLWCTSFALCNPQKKFSLSLQCTLEPLNKTVWDIRWYNGGPKSDVSKQKIYRLYRKNGHCFFIFIHLF